MKTKKNKRNSYIEYDYESAYRKSIEDLQEKEIERSLAENKKDIYALKEIKAGDQLEVEIYPEFLNIDEVPEEARPEKKDNRKAQRNLNTKNAKKHLERLLNENFNNGDLWVTLNYDNSNLPEDLEEATKNIKNYIKRINYKLKSKGYENCKYVYVTEYNPIAKIRFHHHLVISCELSIEEVEETWKAGKRNHIRRLERDEKGLCGMANYITKASQDDTRTKNKKRWGSSINLKKYNVKKVHCKKTEEKTGTYKTIKKFVDNMLHDRTKIKDQLSKWYNNYTFLESQIFYNEHNNRFYIKVRLRQMDHISSGICRA